MFVTGPACYMTEWKVPFGGGWQSLWSKPGFIAWRQSVPATNYTIVGRNRTLCSVAAQLSGLVECYVQATQTTTEFRLHAEEAPKGSYWGLQPPKFLQAPEEATCYANAVYKCNLVYAYAYVTIWTLSSGSSFFSKFFPDVTAVCRVRANWELQHICTVPLVGASQRRLHANMMASCVYLQTRQQ